MSDLMDEVAEIFHDNWAAWVSYVLMSEEEFKVSPEKRADWELFLVEWKDLPEIKKEKTRMLANEILDVVKSHLKASKGEW
jgi:hypothetical protein